VWIEEQMVDKSFLVAGTFRTYGAALKEAERIARRTGLEHPTEEVELVDSELSYSRKTCEDGGWDYPCYVARGRYDDGAYLSIEPSGAYDGFRPGYFMVVAASGDKEQIELARHALARGRVKSYARSSRVWMGCMS
jgi:hypothetical protein